MVVELADVNLPLNLVGGAVLDLDGEISAVVEAAELRGRNGSSPDGTGFGGLRCGLGLGRVKGRALATGALTTLRVFCTTEDGS